MLNQLSK